MPGTDDAEPERMDVASAQSGDDAAFTTLVERHRRELRVHCYRMLGSFEEAEDLVQDTFLRAWKHRGSFEGRSSIRAWLYRIATNACLDALAGKSRRVLPDQLAPPSDPRVAQPVRTDVAWLQPFPDHLLDPTQPSDSASPSPELVAPSGSDPDAVVIARETIELAFLAAIQHLPPKQRAVLILRDVLGWSAKETASLLDASVPAVNSALQRARATLRVHLPERRLDWSPATVPTDEERTILRRYMEAVERADLATVADLLAEDVRTTMPPWPMWFQGRDNVLAALAASWDATSPAFIGRFTMLPIRANGLPAAAGYLRRPDDPTDPDRPVSRAFVISVIRIENSHITEITGFHDPGLFAAFGLPAELSPDEPPPMSS